MSCDYSSKSDLVNLIFNRGGKRDNPIVNHWRYKRTSRSSTLHLHLGCKRQLAAVTVLVSVDLSRCRVNGASLFEIHHTGCDQIKNLTDVEHHTHYRCPHHEVGENGLLSGAGNVAVHQIGTGTDITLDLPGQLEAVVDVVEQVEKRDFEGGFDKQADQVGPPETTMLLARVVVQPSVFAMLGLVLAFPFFSVGHMQNDHERRAGDEDELESPKPNVGDREEVIIADVGATWLTGIAVKVSLVVTPHTLSCHHEDQHPEDEDHRQPDASEGSGVLVDPAEETLEKLPIHELSVDSVLCGNCMQTEITVKIQRQSQKK